MLVQGRQFAAPLRCRPPLAGLAGAVVMPLLCSLISGLCPPRTFRLKLFSAIFWRTVRQLMADPIGSAADSGGLGGLFWSPPESASADALADCLADPIGPDRIRSDPIGSAADPPRT